MKPPPAATPSEQWELNRLRYLPAAQFDAQYASLEVKDRRQDIEETGFDARRGLAASVREEARKDPPMLVLHLHLAEKAVRSKA
jgi:hypothetical protein